MNTRLGNQYTSIEESNKDKFLNNQIEIDTTWGKHISGATLQIDLNDAVRDVLGNYQKELDALEPGNLLLLPRQFQHISFNQVVFWGGQYALGTKGTWESIASDFISAYKELNNNFPSFKVMFSKLIATTGAIIWCAYDENDQMENLRNTFLQKLPFPKETTRFNHIIHTTIARYKHTLNNPQHVYDFIQNKNHTVSMLVKKIILRKENIYPSIQTKNICYIKLK